jgi:formamidopyrimidine-DNA glycosylase
MPELPEVETVRLGLLKKLPGKKVVDVKVLRPASIGYPEPAQFARSLKGHRFEDIQRRGKYILFELNDGAMMVVHLRMSGRLLINAQSAARREHIRVRIALDSGEELVFEDMRVFGRLWFVPSSKKVERVVSGLADLGIEPLEKLSGRYMQEAFRKRTQAIKSALLDQTVIAGIGNIYADESLHLARINPRKPARELSLAELDELAKQIKHVLSKAIDARGSSLRNYTDDEGVNGDYQNRALVYGRTGEPCRNCGTEIERVKLAGRSSHYCPECQPGPRARRTPPTKKTGRSQKRGTSRKSAALL